VNELAIKPTFCILCGRMHFLAQACEQRAPGAKSIAPSDIASDMASDMATAMTTNITDELISLRGELAAAKEIIAIQSTALTSAHSALLAGNVDYAIEIISSLQLSVIEKPPGKPPMTFQDARFAIIVIVLATAIAIVARVVLHQAFTSGAFS
jgi:hypothetical protein